MKSFLNNTNLKEINQKLPEFIQSINKTNEEVTNYINNSKINEIEINENEKEEQIITKYENLYDQIDEINNRRILINKNVIEMKEKAKEMILEVEKIEEEFKNNEINFSEFNNEIIGKIIEYEEKKMIRDKKPHEEEIKEIERKYNEKKKEMEKKLKNVEEIKKRREEE